MDECKSLVPATAAYGSKGTADTATAISAAANASAAAQVATQSIEFSCFRWGGFISRSLSSRGALTLPLDELLAAAHVWSRRELEACGLGGAVLLETG